MGLTCHQLIPACGYVERMRRFNLILLFFLVWGGCAEAVWAAERMSVKAEVANIRSAPSAEAELLWQVEKYHPLLVLKHQEKWYFIKDFEGDQGWIHQDLLDKTQTVIVNGTNCNVRAGAGTEYDILFTVNKGIPFKILKKEGRWLHVQHSDGDSGWIFDSLVW
jgi:SH3-like domain-containing protein